MVNSLLNTDTCVGATKASGMVTQWTMAGTATAYTGTAKAASDGYNIIASMTWAVVTSLTGSGTAATETINNLTAAYGTCVETLVAATSVRVAKTVTTDGNNALCHWIYFKGGASSDKKTVASGTDYAETRYLTYD